MMKILKNKLNFNLVLVFFAIIFLHFQPAYAIKIGLLTGTRQAYIATSNYGSLVDGYTGHKLMDVQPMQVYLVKSSGAQTVISANNRIFKSNYRYLVLRTSKGGFVYTKNRWYRDKIILYNLGNALTIINDVSLENYLKGVVPSEMPRSWNLEAHKAQAIAARSYAVANLGKRARYGYDLKDTPEDQAYGGASSESIRTNKAVDQTKGEVLVYGNKVIPAYYSSSAGGYTLNASSVWLKDLPYIKSVPSFDGNIPRNGHGVGMSQHGANVLANYGYSAYQILGYFYKNVQLYKLNNVI